MPELLIQRDFLSEAKLRRASLLEKYRVSLLVDFFLPLAFYLPFLRMLLLTDARSFPKVQLSLCFYNRKRFESRIWKEFWKGLLVVTDGGEVLGKRFFELLPEHGPIWLCFVLCDYIRSQFLLANPAAPFGRLWLGTTFWHLISFLWSVFFFIFVPRFFRRRPL